FYVGSEAMGTVASTDSAHWVVSGGTITATLPNAQLLEPSFTGAPGNMAPGSHTVTAAFAGVDRHLVVSNPTTTFTVHPEAARVPYVGAVFVLTQSTSTYTATVNLRATVQDITAVPTDPNYDPYAGDIRNATVTFVMNPDTTSPT